MYTTLCNSYSMRYSLKLKMYFTSFNHLYSKKAKKKKRKRLKTILTGVLHPRIVVGYRTENEYPARPVLSSFVQQSLLFPNKL